LNALKYFSKIVPPMVAIWAEKKVGGELFRVYFTFEMIATLYCLLWDFYMDWGLL
jgi:hypothetical protein